MRFSRAAALLALVILSLAAAALGVAGAGAQGTAAAKPASYVVLNSWDAKLIPQIRKKHPGVRVLAYKNLSLTVAAPCVDGKDDEHVPGGAGYCAASAHHPEWFVTQPTGTRINSHWFPGAWLMDIGSAAYQRSWLDSVVGELKGQGWDGVFVDDADADPNWHLQGRTIAKYPTMKSWQTATRSMLATVGAGLKGNGLLFIPNIYVPWSGSYNALAIWKDWLQFTSGASQEYFTKWGDASSDWFVGPDWTFRQSFQKATEKAGKIFIGITYAPRKDTKSLLYARSNFLLHTTGGKSALLFKNDREMGDPESKTWRSPIGRPVTAPKKVGQAWRRAFSGGVVVVNPSPKTVTVKLGKRYRNASGKVVTKVRLRPATGAILKTVRR